MKKTLIGMATLTLLLGGCASKPKVELYKGAESGAQHAYIRVANGAGSPSWSHNESKAFRDALETAARVTLQKGYKYFAIYYPSEIANTKGSLDNTAEELLAKCDPNAAAVLDIGIGGVLHKCGTHNTNAVMRIMMYHEQQEKFTVIDAQKVIDFYKSHDIYDDFELDIKEK